MKRMLACTGLVVFLASPAWAGEIHEFDPDQPFHEALERHAVELWVGKALEALEEHFEISARFDRGGRDDGRSLRLRFQFYPEGKSKSKESITAEGWFGSSKDSREQELHFKFALPRSADGSSADQDRNVL